MIEFNKEEISLCKQIAEKHRKDLKIGMYVWRDFCKTVQLIYRLDEEDKEIFTVILKRRKLNHLYWNNLEGGWLTPLWTISDCLEFLRERDIDLTLNYFTHVSWWQIQLWNESSTQAFYSDFNKENKNKTPLEACLKAVLVVLEEGK